LTSLSLPSFWRLSPVQAIRSLFTVLSAMKLRT